MEAYIKLSFLNDFIFCPRSIYFHQLYGNFHHSLYKQAPQYKGKAAHETIDTNKYSTSAHILQGTDVYSSQYNICGKIDVFDIDKGVLTERKREIKTIYDGYVFQVYAQCFGLRESGYKVNKLILHDLVHNKNYTIDLPEDNKVLFNKFEKLINNINTFDLEKTPFVANKSKCENCIYNQLCDASLC